MKNKRFILIGVLVVGVIVIALIVTTLLHTQTPTSSLTPLTGTTVDYTDALTGSQQEDKPTESAPPVGGFLPTPSANILGLNLLSGYFTDEQTSELQTILNNFLLAQSGLSNVTAGISNGSLSESTQNGQQLMKFTIKTIRPQATYAVTATITNQYQVVPDVTIKQTK